MRARFSLSKSSADAKGVTGLYLDRDPANMMLDQTNFGRLGNAAAKPKAGIKQSLPMAFLLMLSAAIAFCQNGTNSPPSTVRVHQAPPEPPPISSQTIPQFEADAELSAASLSLYSIGDPTGEEQFYLELVNRARANPNAEAQIFRNTADPDVLSAYNYFNVDLDLMVSQFASLPPAPPLSMNAKLLAAARLHSLDMFTNGFQGHTGSDGRSPGARITAQAYSWSTYGECVYAWAESVFYGHAGFEVDWGNGPGGMQTPPGHRLNIHSAAFREVGIGVVNGQTGLVGPQLVTQDFANSPGSRPFITGVAYYDFNGNQFYDPGEGIPGIAVEVAGASAYAITTNSGGYSVPVASDGSYEVTFSAGALVLTQRTVNISSSRNSKLDFIPSYTGPVVDGPTNPSFGRATAYSFNAVIAATSHQWKSSRRTPVTAVEGAEDGLSNVTVSVSGYSAQVSGISASGGSSFHLAHPQPVDQTILLNRRLCVGANSRLIFASRLGWATVTQVARTQASTDDGATWNDLWNLAGTGSAGQTVFVTCTNSLAAFTGREILIRFIYDFTGGSRYTQTTAGVGWYIDEIRLTNAEELTDEVITDTSTNGFSFNPTVAADYSLCVRAILGGRTFNWGPALLVSAVSGGPFVRITGAPVVVGSRVALTFEVTGGAASEFQVEVASSPDSAWTLDTSATFQAAGQGRCYRANVANPSPDQRFFRIIIPR